MRGQQRLIRLLVTCSLMAAATACTRSQGAKDKTESNLPPAEKKAMEDYRAEIEIGRNMAGRLLSYYGVVENDKLSGYLNQVGDYVASYSDYPERRYMFAVLKHESVNAFACPGGYILVTMGAIRAAKNEAELAMVLGHEVAHVGRRHMFDTLRKMKEKDLAEAAKKRDLGGPDQEAIKVRERPVAEDNEFNATLARYLAGSAGAGLNVLLAAQAGMNLITETGLGPELEYEADSEGVKYAVRAGYEPNAMLGYLKRLEGDGTKKRVKNLEKTHPPIEQRRAAIAKVLKALNAEDIIGASGAERFDKLRKTFPKPE